MALVFQHSSNAPYRRLGPLVFEGDTKVHDRFKCSQRAHRDKMVRSARWSLHLTFRLRQLSHAWVDNSARRDDACNMMT
jgi:hypothetical protein